MIFPIVPRSSFRRVRQNEEGTSITLRMIEASPAADVGPIVPDTLLAETAKRQLAAHRAQRLNRESVAAASRRPECRLHPAISAAR